MSNEINPKCQWKTVCKLIHPKCSDTLDSGTTRLSEAKVNLKNIASIFMRLGHNSKDPDMIKICQDESVAFVGRLFPV